MKSYSDIVEPYQAYLAANGIPPREHGDYAKWLRYYLDFCEKYRLDRADPESLPPFLRKLAQKGQSQQQRQQADGAVKLLPDNSVRVRPKSREIRAIPPVDRDPTGAVSRGPSAVGEPARHSLVFDSVRGHAAPGGHGMSRHWGHIAPEAKLPCNASSARQEFGPCSSILPPGGGARNVKKRLTRR